MKTRKSLMALLILGGLFCIGLPFLFNSTTSQATLTVITSLLTAYTSFLTLVVAVMLFNRFGLESRILEKQFEAVSGLLETINKLDFVFMGENMMIRVRPLQPLPVNLMETCYARRIGLNEAYMDQLDSLTQHANNIYLPPAIVEKIKPFLVYFISKSQNFSAEHDSLLWVASKKDSKINGDLVNGSPITFQQFISQWDDLVKAAEDWIRSHAEMPTNLNLRQ
jgi:hypothetical protein